MALWKTDPSFYPSARMASQAPAERLAYVVTFDPQTALKRSANGKPDSLAVIDVDPSSASYGQIAGRLELGSGNELHHFGWNACSAALCPYAPHPHVERRYFVIPGLRSSRIFIVDTKPDPRHPTLVAQSNPKRWRRAPVTAVRTPCIADPTQST